MVGRVILNLYRYNGVWNRGQNCLACCLLQWLIYAYMGRTQKKCTWILLQSTLHSLKPLHLYYQPVLPYLKKTREADLPKMLCTNIGDTLIMHVTLRSQEYNGIDKTYWRWPFCLCTTDGVCAVIFCGTVKTVRTVRLDLNGSEHFFLKALVPKV